MQKSNTVRCELVTLIYLDYPALSSELAGFNIVYDTFVLRVCLYPSLKSSESIIRTFLEFNADAEISFVSQLLLQVI